jgi:hypothetical protein
MKRDLWVSLRTVFDIWSPPLNLGPVINSASNELTPYSPGPDLLSVRSLSTGWLVDLYATKRAKAWAGR